MATTWFRAIREDLGLTLEDVSRLTGVKLGTVMVYDSGQELPRSPQCQFYHLFVSALDLEEGFAFQHLTESIRIRQTWNFRTCGVKRPITVVPLLAPVKFRNAKPHLRRVTAGLAGDRICYIATTLRDFSHDVQAFRAYRGITKRSE